MNPIEIYLEDILAKMQDADRAAAVRVIVTHILCDGVIGEIREIVNDANLDD